MKVICKNAVPGSRGYTGKTYVIVGTEDGIVGTINAKLDDTENSAYGMQSLRRRDGTIKITVNRAGFMSS